MSGPELTAWVAFAAAVTAAAVAGVFGLLQARRNVRAQRRLELEKLRVARQENELARVAGVRSEYRKNVVQPFLEALNSTIVASYAVVQVPRQHIRLAGRVPPLRKHIDGVLGTWFDAMQELSDHRVQALLGVGISRAPRVAELLSSMVVQARELVQGRAELFGDASDPAALREAHERYVRTGYRLLAEVTAALDMPEGEEPGVDEGVAAELVPLLEKGGVVAAPYGRSHMPSWIGIWEVHKDPEVQRYVESVSRGSDEEVSGKLVSLVRALLDREDVVEANLLRIEEQGSEPEQVLQVFCIPATFESVAARDAFVERSLPEYRRAHRLLWSSVRVPTEIVTD